MDVGEITRELGSGGAGEKIPTEESGEPSRRGVKEFFVFWTNVAEDEKGIG